MRPKDLPSLQVLAKRAKHGSKVKYNSGCRCRTCVTSYKIYCEQLKANAAAGNRNNLVPTDRVKKFLQEMRGLGIGYMTVAKHVGVGKTGLGLILWPGNRPRQFIRAQKEKKVLSYVPTLDTMPRQLKIPADETVQKLRQMMEWGYPKLLIGRAGMEVKWTAQIHALEGRCKTVKVSTAIKIRDFYSQVVAVREEWLASGREIPPRQYVWWKEGSIGCTVEEMELRGFIRAFDFHYRYPPELREAITLVNALSRKTKEANRHAKEHARGSSQSPVRHPGEPDGREAPKKPGRPQGSDRTLQSRGERGKDHHRSGQDGGRLHEGHRRGASDGLLRQAR